jgi:hypothetical protein
MISSWSGLRRTVWLSSESVEVILRTGEKLSGTNHNAIIVVISEKRCQRDSKLSLYDPTMKPNIWTSNSGPSISITPFHGP